MDQDNNVKPKLRIPIRIGDVQVNFCKNPACPNFGVPASQEKQPRGQYAKDKERDNYTIVSGDKLKTIVLKCNLCGEHPTIKSNLAISEEINRLSRYLTVVPTDVSCANPDCSNHLVTISTPKCYVSFGKTKAGSQRYRCSLCRKVFSVGKPTIRQKQPHKNATIFKLLMNKVPFARICEVAGLGSMNALYWKISFLHKQCLSFAADRERKLLGRFPIERLYIGTDRQDYMVNWSNAADKRNIMLLVAPIMKLDMFSVFTLTLIRMSTQERHPAMQKSRETLK